MLKQEKILIIFNEENVKHEILQKFDVVVCHKKLHHIVIAHKRKWLDLQPLLMPGSIYEANDLLIELSLLTFPDGTRISKSFTYKGYELWWIHYTNLLHNFCLPYTQFKKLLHFLKDFKDVTFYDAPFKSLFVAYLSSYTCKPSFINKRRIKTLEWLPLGIFIQITLTFLWLPVAVFLQRKIMIFTGDKFDGLNDYDFRMKFVYEELNKRQKPFIEFVRSLEPWNVVLEHAARRRRPVIYTVGISYIARYISTLSGGRYRSRKKYNQNQATSLKNVDECFKYSVATWYLNTVSDDVWEIRIMRFILALIGVKVAFPITANDRNFHTVLACKLEKIPTIGILHGVALYNNIVYEFMPMYDGKKRMTVDKYGLWSEWWKGYFKKYSSTYTQDQLYISGLMRPIQKNSKERIQTRTDRCRVLFISEEVAVPEEITPYLEKLLEQGNIEVTIKFRPHRDGYEGWLMKHRSDILNNERLTIVRGSIHDAVKDSNVVVGSYSTAVLEAVLQNKVPLFCHTQKWGDYYGFKKTGESSIFFTDNPDELLKKVENAKTVQMRELNNLREKYFGDPYQNGSKWVVDTLIESIG